MKNKVTDILKPNILIIFGALMLLFFMDYLSAKGAALAIGIIAVICAVYYLVIGIFSIVMGDKFSASVKTLIEVISVALFCVFMFVVFLIDTIGNADFMGPTDWVVSIVSMIVALALAVVYAGYKFIDKAVIARFVYLFSAIFALVLLLNVLQAANGTLGGINIYLAAIYACFIFYLFNSLKSGAAKTSDAE